MRKFINIAKRNYSTKIVKTIAECKQVIKPVKTQEKSLGFVPTMGALHSGHISLVQAAKKQCEAVAVSIFVNPTQFGPNEDFNKYPRQLENDVKLLEEVGVDFVFAPAAEEVYGKHASRTSIHENNVEKYSMESACRPGHFAGVCTVVTKLFNIVEPSIAFFGAKDAVQCIVVKNIVQDLNMNVKIEIVETMREANGLAMSSRNSYLTSEQRNRAAVIYKSLLAGKSVAKKGIHVNAIKQQVEKVLKSETMITSIEYVSCMDASSAAELIDTEITCDSIVLSLAVKMDKVRLIDNIAIKL